MFNIQQTHCMGAKVIRVIKLQRLIIFRRYKIFPTLPSHIVIVRRTYTDRLICNGLIHQTANELVVSQWCHGKNASRSSGM